MSLMRTGFFGAATTAFLFSPSALRADLDKESKDKKDEKEARPVMDGDEHEEYHRQLIETGEKNLAEIQKLLDEIQKNLSDKQTGASTQERQKEVSERLEKLIKELEKG